MDIPSADLTVRRAVEFFHFESLNIGRFRPVGGESAVPVEEFTRRLSVCRGISVVAFSGKDLNLFRFSQQRIDFPCVLQCLLRAARIKKIIVLSQYQGRARGGGNQKIRHIAPQCGEPRRILFRIGRKFIFQIAQLGGDITTGSRHRQA